MVGPALLYCFGNVLNSKQILAALQDGMFLAFCDGLKLISSSTLIKENTPLSSLYGTVAQ